MSRTIKRTRRTVSQSPITLCVNLRGWLRAQALEHNLRWLLAHDHEGIIWGELRGDALHLSCEAHPQGALTLRWDTLIQCRLFGANRELLVWRGPEYQQLNESEGWQARLCIDEPGQDCEYFDEGYLLWGTEEAATPSDGFRLLREGAQGILHAPPLVSVPTEARRATLVVRHYLATDEESGATYVSDSRMVALPPQL